VNNGRRAGGLRVRPQVLVLVGGLCLPGPDVLAQPPNDAPYAAARLIGRWRTVMNRALEEERASAAESVTDRMEEFVSPGAVRAIKDKASEEQLKRADAALERLVQAMVHASARRPDGSVIVEESALEPGERAICPVYPFCDR
jgi:hypothetical protein